MGMFCTMTVFMGMLMHLSMIMMMLMSMLNAFFFPVDLNFHMNATDSLFACFLRNYVHFFADCIYFFQKYGFLFLCEQAV